MSKPIEIAFESLDRVDQPLALPDILVWLRELPLTLDDFSGYLIFSPDRYVRNPLHDGAAYQALVLCWRNGQRSPIHDHRGSSCGVPQPPRTGGCGRDNGSGSPCAQQRPRVRYRRWRRTPLDQGARVRSNGGARRRGVYGVGSGS